MATETETETEKESERTLALAAPTKLSKFIFLPLLSIGLKFPYMSTCEVRVRTLNNFNDLKKKIKFHDHFFFPFFFG